MNHKDFLKSTDFDEFCEIFDVQVNDLVDIPVDIPIINPGSGTSTATAVTPGIDITLSTHNMIRIIQMLKSKGYFHDETYQVRMREEELVLTHNDLHDLHNQYRTLLYLLMQEE